MTIDSEIRDAEAAAIVAAAKTEDGYQCRWCRRNLQQPSGLMRHRAYCSWNPSLRDWDKDVLVKTVKQEPASPSSPSPSPDRHQCEWCNRFFQNQKGVLRHKTYCAWNPLRLRALKEDRARVREQKAALKSQRNFRTAVRQSFPSLNSPSPPNSSLPTSPLSSADSTPVSPRSPFNFPSGQMTPRSREESNPFTFNQAKHSSRARHPYKPEPATAHSPVHVSVITSFDLDCNCGCSKHPHAHHKHNHHNNNHSNHEQQFLQARAFVTNQLRKSSIESPSSSPQSTEMVDEDYDEEIDVES